MIISERNRVMITAAIAFFAGCVLCTYLSCGFWLWLVAGLGIVTSVLLKCSHKPCTLGLCIVFFALGCLRADAAMNLSMPDPGSYNITATVSGQVKDRGDHRYTFLLKNIRLDGKPVKGTAYCTYRTNYIEGSPQILFDGDVVEFEGRVYAPTGKSGYPHFDFKLWMRQNRIHFGISTYKEISVKINAGIQELGWRIRNAIEQKLHMVLGKNTRYAMAILFGDRSAMTTQEYESFQKLGIAHIMSVSGLHIGILGGIVIWFLKKLRINRWVRLPLLTMVLLGYAGICGFSIAAVRATIMMVVYSARALFSRSKDQSTTLALSALIILVLNPLQAISAGFILSFCAVISLMAIAPVISRWLDLWIDEGNLRGGKSLKVKLYNLRRSLIRNVKSTFAASVGVQIGILLPSVYFFHQVPLYGVIINILLVPVVCGILTPLLYLTAILSFVPGINGVLGKVTFLCIDAFLQITGLLVKLPGAVVKVGNPGPLIVFGAVLIIIVLSKLSPFSIKKKAILAAIICVVSVTGTFLLRPAQTRYIQISAGQEDAALLIDGNKTILIDAGQEGDEVLDYLLWQGRNVDALYLTHLHWDHIGGVNMLLDKGIRIGAVYIPSEAEKVNIDEAAVALMNRIREANIPVYEISAGERHEYDNFSIDVLWPQKGQIRNGADPNTTCLVMKLDMLGYQILTTADITDQYEMYSAVQADVLKVAHHGSAKSSSDRFLHTVNPSVCIISCSGSSNSLPAPSTMERLNNLGICILRTDETGDITISVGTDGLHVVPYIGK